MQRRILIFALCCSAITSARAETIRWGFSPTDPAPYVVMHGDKLGHSLTRALGERVASQLGWTVEFVEVPNNRLDRSLRGGRIDVACNTVPAWHLTPFKHTWSQPLYRDGYVLVTRSGERISAQLSDMSGMRVGAGHDQHYPPKLIEAFRDGTLQRLDVRDTETRLRMVEHDRLDATVERRRAMEYYFSQNPDHRLTTVPWTLSELSLRCVAEQRHRSLGTRAVETLDTLTKEQYFTRLLADFGLTAER